MTKHLLVSALLALALSYGAGPHSTRGQDLAGSSKEKPSSDNAQVLAEASRLNESMIELFKVAKYDEALPVGKRVLELQQRALGPQHLLIAKTLKNIGEIYLAKKKHDEAEKLFRQALTIFEREPEQNETVSYLLETLGVIQFNKRQYHKAALLLEKALAVREKVSGKTDVALAETLHALANVYQVQRRFEEAEPLYLRALSIKEKTLGRSDSGTVAAMKDYACLNLRDSKVTVVKPGSKGEDLDSDDRVGK